MRITQHEVCRAYGRLHLRVDIEGITKARSAAARGLLRASLVINGHRLPARIRPYRFRGLDVPESHCVIDFPEISARKALLEVWHEGPQGDRATLRIKPRKLVWESRANRRVRGGLIEALLEGVDALLPGSYQLTVQGCFERETGVSLRVRVAWQAEQSDHNPEIAVFDRAGNELDADIRVLERDCGQTASSYLSVSSVTLALCLPEGLEWFSVRASDPRGLLTDGFVSMDPCHLSSLRKGFRAASLDACGDDNRYRAWLAQHRSSAPELALQRERSSAMGVSFSIVVPCFQSDSSRLRELVDSILSQSYPRWELLLLDASPESNVVRGVCSAVSDLRVIYVRLERNAGIVGNTNEGIQRAKGDYVAFVDHDDLLEPDALYWYAEAIGAKSPDERPQVLYCDEDSFHESGDFGQPSFKSDLNVDLLYSHNYVTHLLVVERALIESIGLSTEDVSGAQDYDLTLRALGAGARFHHVARVLYHWRIHEDSTNAGNVGSKPYALEAGRLALERHLTEREIGAQVETTYEPFVYRVRYALPEPQPLVSVIIPTRDHVDMLAPCVRSLFETSAYQNIEVLLVENGSADPATEELYSELCSRHPDRVRVLRWDGGFNYSRLINYGASHAQGDYLLLLNNDTEVISPDCVVEMLGYLQRPEVGVVGAKLYFADDLVQHAGMVVGAYDALVHVNQYFPPSRPGYLARAVRPGNFSAVTGACQMVRKTVFWETSGYDPDFAVGFNDADFCLRVIRAGYLVTFTPYAELYHHEFASRGRDTANDGKAVRWKREQALFMQRWPEYFVGRDPYSNPNLRRDNLYFALDTH